MASREKQIETGIKELECDLKTVEWYIENNSPMPKIVEDLLREGVQDITVAKKNLEDLQKEVMEGKWK